jgi:hypothetical protein
MIPHRHTPFRTDTHTIDSPFAFTGFLSDGYTPIPLRVTLLYDITL